MAKYIDADFLINEIEKYNNENWDNLTWSSHMVASFLREAPKVDAVEIVRCKDCVFYKSMGCAMQGFYMHDASENREQDFCSYGERKER